MKTSPATRVPRGRRGTVATVTALVGVLVFAAAATEAISFAAHKRTLGYRAGTVAKFGRDTHLGDRVVLVVSVVALVVGVALILAALLPPRRRLVELTEPDPNVAAGLTSRSLHRALCAAAQAIDGVGDVKATGRRRIKIVATTSLRDTESLPDRITERVTACLNALNPTTSRTVRVVLDRKDD